MKKRIQPLTPAASTPGSPASARTWTSPWPHIGNKAGFCTPRDIGFLNRLQQIRAPGDPNRESWCRDSGTRNS